MKYLFIILIVFGCFREKFFSQHWHIKVGSIAKDNSFASWKDTDVNTNSPDTLRYPKQDSQYLHAEKSDSLIIWWFINRIQ